MLRSGSVAWRALCKHLATSFGQSVACAASGSYCSKERPAGELGAGVRSMSTQSELQEAAARAAEKAAGALAGFAAWAYERRKDAQATQKQAARCHVAYPVMGLGEA